MPVVAMFRFHLWFRAARTALVCTLSVVAIATTTWASDALPPATSRVCAAIDGTMPQNVILRPPFPEVTREMLRLSPTFRAQCERLAAAADRVIVIVRLDIRVPRRFAARTFMGRTPEGHLVARVDVRSQPDFTEIIAHELEHAIEQIDRWPLPAMALAKGEAEGEVFEVSPDVFETARAIRIGRLVESEVFTRRRSPRPTS